MKTLQKELIRYSSVFRQISFVSSHPPAGNASRSIILLSILIFTTSDLHAQLQTGGFEFEGEKRVYMVFLPQDYDGIANLPLVIYLHCYGESADWGRRYTQFNQVADTANFIVAYPSAIPNWNSGLGENPDWPTPDVNDVGFIDALIDTLYNHFSIDLKRIYTSGFSNGGFMSYKLACQLSHRIAAIASVSGVLSSGTAENCTPLRTMPVLHIHGTADDLLPLNGATGCKSVDQTLSYWRDFNSCVQVDSVLLPDIDPTDGCTVKKIIYSSCLDESKVIFYKVINGGHSWPSAAADYSWSGKRTNDINGGVEIWDFFKNYELVTSIERIVSTTPRKFQLLQNYPNPFNPSTTIEYQIPKNSQVDLSIYNLLGQKVAILVNKKQSAGSYQVNWNANGFASGIYVYTLETSTGFKESNKLLLVK